MSPVNASEIFAQVEAAVPERSFVFGGVLLQLQQILTNKMPAAFELQLYIMSAFYGLQLLMLIASLAFRFAAGDRWLFRTVRCRFGTYITPNFGSMWQIWICFFLIAVQVNLWLLAQIQESVPAGYYFGTVVVWIAFWWAALSAVWSLAVSQCEVDSRASLQPKFWQRPWFIHGIFIGYPLIELISTCVIGGLVNGAFKPEINSIRFAAESLIVAAQEAPLMSPSQLDSAIATQIAQLQFAFDKLANFYRLFRISGSINLAHDLATWLIYIFISGPYLFKLRKQLREPAPSAFASNRELKRSIYTAAATCTALSLACLAFAVVQAYQIVLATANPNTAALLLDTLAIQWIFAVLGLPLCVGALYRSVQLQQAKSREAGQLSLMAQSSLLSSSVAAQTSASKRSMSFVKTLSPLSRDVNRFEVTMERVTEVDAESSPPLGRFDEKQSSANSSPHAV